MPMRKKVNPWEDVVISMLSTGGYRLGRTYKYRDLLIENGLTNIVELSKMDEATIAKKLCDSGYERGPVLTAMYTDRLISLAKLSKNASECEDVLLNGNADEVSALLTPIKGVGPIVIKQYLMLRESK